MTLDVAEIAGTICITVESGIKLHDEITRALDSGESVDLDFGRVEVYASPFFNAAIGQLLRDYSAELLNERLRFDRLSEDGAAVLRKVIANSREYYGEQATRSAVDEVASDIGTDE